MPFFAPAPVTHVNLAKAHAVHKVKKKQDGKAQKKASGASPVRTNLPLDPNMVVQANAAQGGYQGSAGARTLLPTDAPAAGQGGTQQPKVLVPTDAQSPAKTNIATAANAAKGESKLKWVHDTYFDAGASDLIGTFTTQIIRYGVRYEQSELHIYAKNETLDTTGTNLPFRSIVSGASAGIGYRYWLPGNHAFATVSYGKYFSGDNKNKSDFRVGAAGYYDWKHKNQFTDYYGDLFYIDIAQDVFISSRLRTGLVLFQHGGDSGTGYFVLQGFGSGKGDNGTENRIEAGFGVAYVFQKKISLNVELRGGYAYRGTINNRTYLNPQIVLSGGL